MEPNLICPSCGKPVVPGAPAGLCLDCLMKSGPEAKPMPGSAILPPAMTVAPVMKMAGLFPYLEFLAPPVPEDFGMGYKARQPSLNRIVVLKILTVDTKNDPSLAERFTREARALAWLSLPQIVSIYDLGEVQGNYFLLTEFVDGQTLRQVLQSRRVTMAEAFQIVPQICAALQYAHENGVFHGRLKPENIFLDKNGQVKIAGFGLTHLLAGSATNASPAVAESSPYLAPEQLEKLPRGDARSDLYSVGVIFYELLTGERPVGNFPPPSQKIPLDVRLDEIILHALEKNPARRYQKAAQLKTDVETIVRTTTMSMPAVPATVSVPPPLPVPSVAKVPKVDEASRNPMFFAVGMVGVLLIGLALALWLGAAWWTGHSHSTATTAANPENPSPATNGASPGAAMATAPASATPEIPTQGLVALWSGEDNGDDSAGANNAILTDVSFVDGQVGHAFALNGKSSMGFIPANPALDLENTPGLSISAWINPSDVSRFHPLVEWCSTNAQPEGTGCQLRIGRNAKAQGRLVAFLVDLEGHFHVLASPPHTLVKDQFQQVAVTYDQASGQGVLYVNGKNVAQATWGKFRPKTKGDIWVSDRPFTKASDALRNSHFAGLLDEIAIYNRALTPDDITALYQAGLAGKNPLAAINH